MHAPDSSPTNRNRSNRRSISDKSYLVTLLLCFFLGVFGVHRFYVGKIGTGLLMILTFGGLGIWALIDLTFIICSRFRDRRGGSVFRAQRRRG